jgi:hypothetical protein
VLFDLSRPPLRHFARNLEIGMSTLRYGDLLREISLRQREVRYGDIATYEAAGEEPRRRIELRPLDVYRLLQPYVSVRLVEQVRAVVPLALYLVLFELLILRHHVADSWTVTAGLLAVIVGLMLFMEGLKLGLMPFGEALGNVLPARARLPVVLLVTFALGVGVTFAEPAIGALQTAGSSVRGDQAPLLVALLGPHSQKLVLAVGAGVGLAAVLGTLRFLYGWSLKPLIYATVGPALALSVYALTRPDLARVTGLAWDCGGVTTGPVTVPLVLALGIGVAASAGKGDSTLNGFGIVTLASILPVMGVLGLGLWLGPGTGTTEAVAVAAAEVPAWHQRSPWLEVVLALRAIVPLVLFLLVVIRLLRERVRNPGLVAYGIGLAVVGMIVFNLGLSYGLAKLGGQAGGLVPSAFVAVDGIDGSPLYRPTLGGAIAIAFALVLGFGATLAEPALNALGITVENLTSGAFRKQMLMMSVSVGVGVGIALGVLRLMLDLPLLYLLLPGYALALALTALSSEEFVNVAWDSAGVTTGPVTVPLVLAMGLGFGGAMGSVEGFGILAMASVCPIVSVLALGLYTRWAARRRHRAEDRAAGATA